MARSRYAVASVAVGVIVVLAGASLWAADQQPQGAAAAENGPEARAALSPADALREETRDWLRRTGRAATAARQPVAAEEVAGLVELYERLRDEKALPLEDRQRLKTAVRGRLRQMVEQIRRHGVAQPASVDVPSERTVLAQQLLPIGALANQPSAAAPQADYGEELVELIQKVIAPDTWDVVGGRGVIRYWAPGAALVVTQSGDVHDQLRDLLRDLRW